MQSDIRSNLPEGRRNLPLYEVFVAAGKTKYVKVFEGTDQDLAWHTLYNTFIDKTDDRSRIKLTLGGVTIATARIVHPTPSTTAVDYKSTEAVGEAVSGHGVSS